MRHRLTVFTLVLCACALAVVAPHVAHAMAAHDAHSLGALGALALATGPVVTTASPFAGLLPAELLGREQRTYIAALNWTPIAAGANVPLSLVVDPNHDVVFHRLSYMARDAAGVVVDRPPLFLTMSYESGVWITPSDGTQLDIENVAGINRGAPEFAIPLIVPAGDKLVVTLSNGAAVPLYVRFGFVGFRSSRARR